MTRNNSIEERASFSSIRYSNCWEDAGILLDALAIKNSNNCLSIASSGDNSLALLVNNPALVVAVDISPAQIACVEIRKAVFKHCSYLEFKEFLGFTSSSDSRRKRTEIFSMLKQHLTNESREFWEYHPELIAGGIIHGGKFERYFKMFRTKILPLIHSKTIIKELLDKKTQEDQVDFYNSKWDTWRWRLLFHLFFSKAVMGRIGRDPEFFRYVQGSVAKRILGRAFHALTELPTHDNPYLNYILTGNFGEALPCYARPENFSIIHDNIDKLEIFRGTTQDACKRYGQIFDVYNLSDIFEYMDSSLFAAIAADLVVHAREGARFAYWNMLVPRSIQELMPDRISSDPAQNQTFLLQDRAFFYEQFHLDRKGD